LLVSAGDDRTVRFWNPATGESQATLDGHRDSLTCLAFARDGQWLASGGRSGSLVVWDVAGQAPISDPPSTPGGVAVALTFTPGNTDVYLAVSSPTMTAIDDRLIRVPLQLPARRPIRLPWQGFLWCAAFSPDGRLAALAEQVGTFEMWPVGGPRDTPLRLAGRGPVRALAFSPRGNLLAAAVGLYVELWDLTRKQRLAVLSGHRNSVEALAFTPDGQSLLSGGLDRTVRRWEVRTGRLQGAWDWQVGPVNALAVSPDGLTAAVGGDKPAVVVWDLDDE
jgi:WD40 repeat protein